MLLVVLSALLAAGSARPHNQEPQRDPHPPLSLEQALDRLGKTLPPKTLQEMRRGTERDMITYHFSVGLWMRNSWGLWGQGPLYQSLAQLGLKHPDDMSGLILTCLWRRLHGQPLNIEGEVARYREYWRLTIDPDPKSNPKCRGDIKTTLAFGPDAPRHELVGVHMGACCADGRVWSYQVDRGWYEPTESEMAIWNKPDGRWDACQH